MSAELDGELYRNCNSCTDFCNTSDVANYLVPYCGNSQTIRHNVLLTRFKVSVKAPRALLQGHTLLYDHVQGVTIILRLLSTPTPMGVDSIVIGFDMEVQPLVTHNAA